MSAHAMCQYLYGFLYRYFLSLPSWWLKYLFNWWFPPSFIFIIDFFLFFIPNSWASSQYPPISTLNSLTFGSGFQGVPLKFRYLVLYSGLSWRVRFIPVRIRLLTRAAVFSCLRASFFALFHISVSLFTIFSGWYLLDDAFRCFLILSFFTVVSG